MSSLLIYFVSSVFLKGVVDTALDVNVPSEVIAVKGGSAVFEIGYTESGGDSFDTVSLSKGSIHVFKAPATTMGVLNVNGSFSGLYKRRSSTNYYYRRTQFTITLTGVKRSDEGEYIIQFTKNVNVAVPTIVTRLVLDVLPSPPSITGAPTQPVVDGTGPTVLQCKANLGKPQASMWWSRQKGNAAYTNITENVTMNTANNNDGTTNGTSTLTVNWETGVQYRCQVSNRQATKSAETWVDKETDTTKPTGHGEGGDTFKTTESRDGGDTTKPTGHGEGGDTSKPTESGDGGASVGCEDVPNKIILGVAFVVMAIISTTV